MPLGIDDDYDGVPNAMEAGGDDASKLEAVKGMLMKLVAMLGGADTAPETNPGEIAMGPETGGGEPSGDEAMVPSDPKAKMMALLKAKTQGR